MRRSDGGEGACLNLHSVIDRSRINGPGLRLVVFFQGCDRECPGCFNPLTHPFTQALSYSPAKLLDTHSSKNIEGITVSGGEPFAQLDGLTELLRAAREDFGLTTVVYTGFELEELKQKGLEAPLTYTDVLIDGPFIASIAEPTSLARGSTNQRLHFLSDRYEEADFVMKGTSEIIISPDGIITETGFSRVNTLFG